MPPKTAPKWRSRFDSRVFLLCVVVVVKPLAGQELVLKRDYPGSGPYECPVFPTAQLPSPDDQSRARQLETDANQALILGNLERVEALLAQAIVLDPASPDLAYRHARVLELLDLPERAIVAYCRSLDLDVESIGVTDVRTSIALLWREIREELPSDARDAFRAGLIAADDSLFLEAIESFTFAIELAPGWADPLYNRGAVHEYIGDAAQAVLDFRAYLIVVADPEDADAIAISQRLGALEGAASVATPSPTGALALGTLPGMGYFYTRRPVPGSITLVAAGAAVAVGLFFEEITTLCLVDVPAGGSCPPEDIVDQITEQPYMTAGLVTAGVITLVGAVHAYLTAKRTRSRAEALGIPSAQTQASGLSFGLPTVSTYHSQIDFNIVRYRFR
jgi:hypothetical protein